MNTIYKYPVAVLEKQTIKLPKGASVIRIADVDGMFFMWAIVDTEAELEDVTLACYKTGQPIDLPLERLEYLGLARLYVMQELGLYFFKVSALTASPEDVKITSSENKCLHDFQFNDGHTDKCTKCGELDYDIYPGEDYK